MTKSIEEIRTSVEKLGYYLLDVYVKNSKTRVLIENSLGYRCDVVLPNLIGKTRSGNVSFIDISNTHSLYNISLWLNINNKNFSLCENQEYMGNREKLLFYCFDCKDNFKCSWGNISRGQECGICAGQQVGKYNNLEYLYPNLAKEWHPGNELKPSEITAGSDEKVFLDMFRM